MRSVLASFVAFLVSTDALALERGDGASADDHEVVYPEREDDGDAGRHRMANPERGRANQGREAAPYRERAYRPHTQGSSGWAS